MIALLFASIGNAGEVAGRACCQGSPSSADHREVALVIMDEVSKACCQACGSNGGAEAGECECPSDCECPEDCCDCCGQAGKSSNGLQLFVNSAPSLKILPGTYEDFLIRQGRLELRSESPPSPPPRLS